MFVILRKLSIAVAALTLALGVRADTPNVYVIRGARIVTAAGPPIESGTLVIRRGVIDAVGPSVQPPADADVIDGKGLTVYPGLIDLGNTKAAEQPIPPQPQNIQNSTEVIAHYLYTKAFTGDANPQFGYASAIGVALFFLTLTLAVLMFRASSREKVEY